MEEPRPFHQSSRKFARARRRALTKAETLLWGALRNHGLDGHKFRRQTPIGPYFADFACLDRKLVIEADGRTHNSDEAAVRDAARDAWFARAGYRVLRVSDDLLIGGLPIAIARIRAALAESSTLGSSGASP
jgi:very-short-patch-repair endonuclease